MLLRTTSEEYSIILIRSLKLRRMLNTYVTYSYENFTILPTHSRRICLLVSLLLQVHLTSEYSSEVVLNNNIRSIAYYFLGKPCSQFGFRSTFFAIHHNLCYGTTIHFPGILSELTTFSLPFSFSL